MFDKLPIEVISEDGGHYVLDLAPSNLEYVNRIYAYFSAASESLSDHSSAQSYPDFVARFLNRTTIFLYVFQDDVEVGVIYFKNISEAWSADFGCFFWDRRTKGRQAVMMQAMKWAAEELYIHRFEIRVHALAFYALRRYFNLGAFYEGTKRNAWFYNGSIIDLRILSILTSELTDENVQNGFIPRDPEHRRWYGRLNREREKEKNGDL